MQHAGGLQLLLSFTTSLLMLRVQNQQLTLDGNVAIQRRMKTLGFKIF